MSRFRTDQPGPSAKKRPPASPSVWLVVAAVLLGPGLILGNNVLTQYENHRATIDWPSAGAVIVESTVVGDRASRPQLVFAYEVAGTTYTDTSDLHMPSFGGRNNRRAAAENMAAEYPVGRELMVHYNPDNPAEAHLTQALPFPFYGKLALSVLLILGGVYCAMVSVRLRSAQALAR